MVLSEEARRARSRCPTFDNRLLRRRAFLWMFAWYPARRLLRGFRTVLRPTREGSGFGDSARTLREDPQSHAGAAARVVAAALVTDTTAGEEVEDLAGLLLARRRRVIFR